jgi:hypothetical protein
MHTCCCCCREIIKLPPSALQGLKEGKADDMLAGEAGDSSMPRHNSCKRNGSSVVLHTSSSTATVSGALA